MTDPLPLVAEYKAGLEAEIAMLRRLVALAERGREVAQSRRLDALTEISDARDRIMASLVTVESQLQPIREALARQRERLVHLEAFAEVAALHREAAALATAIVDTDTDSLAALREADMARRFAAESLEKGESTLAAYRRVVMPSLANATLVNRRG